MHQTRGVQQTFTRQTRTKQTITYNRRQNSGIENSEVDNNKYYSWLTIRAYNLPLKLPTTAWNHRDLNISTQQIYVWKLTYNQPTSYEQVVQLFIS